MVGTHVRVRVSSAGTAAGDFVASRQDARLACIETGRRRGADGPVVDRFALVEGVTEAEVGELLVAWNRTYGVPASLAIGTSLAIHLPVPLARLMPAVVARLKALDMVGGSAMGHVLAGPHCDLWIACRTEAKARALADSIRLQLPGSIGALVSIGEPAFGDVECWAALRLAVDVMPAAVST